MSMSTTVVSRTVGNILVLKPIEAGIKDIDAYVAQAIREGHSQIVVDMSGVSYLNGDGLSGLAKSFWAVGKGGGLRLAGLQEQPRQFLAGTRFIHVVSSYPTVDEAVASFTTPAQPVACPSSG